MKNNSAPVGSKTYKYYKTQAHLNIFPPLGHKSTKGLNTVNGARDKNAFFNLPSKPPFPLPPHTHTR